jgi:phospholipase C
MPTIDHVVVLALENRSFDHLLGYLDHPSPDFDGLTRGGPFENPDWNPGPAVEASPTAKRVLPVDPDHSHDAVMAQLGIAKKGDAPTNTGFVTSYERKGRGLADPTFGGVFGPLIAWWQQRNRGGFVPVTGRGPLVMASQQPERVPVLQSLARSFGVYTRWFCSVPGETWPNRNFMHAASSDGETNIAVRFYRNRTIFELLEAAGKRWHIYYDDTPQVWAFSKLWKDDERRANWFEFADFANHVASNTLPTYSFIEPNHRPPLHAMDQAPIVGHPNVSNSQHPGNNLVSNGTYDTYPDTTPTDFARAEQLIAFVYETLRAHPDVFDRTLLLITYDEHGGLYDHVPPPTDVPRSDRPTGRIVPMLRHLFYRRSSRFNFSTLGPRVPAIVISPYVAAGAIDADVRDHSSIPATLRALFAPDAKPLGPRDQWAKRFDTLVTLETARADLPDLATAARVESATVPAPAEANPAGIDDLPSHYKELVGLTIKVHRKMRRRRVPEARQHPIAQLPPREQTERVTDAFTEAAKRARAERTRS